MFPDRAVNENKLSTSTGILNLFGASVGGIPVPRRGRYGRSRRAFGARTGGATIILGVVLLVLALFLSGSVQTLFNVLPRSILGVILFPHRRTARPRLLRFQ